MKIIFVLVTIIFEISTIPFITSQNVLLHIKKGISTSKNVIVDIFNGVYISKMNMVIWATMTSEKQIEKEEKDEKDKPWSKKDFLILRPHTPCLYACSMAKYFCWVLI